MTIKLKYVGDGTGFVGVPARDLTDDEVNQLADDTITVLVASGLYVPVEEEPAKPVRKKLSKGDE